MAGGLGRARCSLVGVWLEMELPVDSNLVPLLSPSLGTVVSVTVTGLSLFYASLTVSCFVLSRCCASGVACSAPLSVVSAFALLMDSLFCVLLCAPVLHFWLVPAEQPLVSEWGAVGRWFCGPSLGAVGGWATPLPCACLPLCVGYPVLAGRLDRASWLVRYLHCSLCLFSGMWVH